MALGYKARRRLSVLVLLVGVPAYVILAVSLIGLIERLHWFPELLAYIVLGIGWVFPLRAVFLGVGREDPDSLNSKAQGSTAQGESALSDTPPPSAQEKP